jgi:hypothetical protein
MRLRKVLRSVMTVGALAAPLLALPHCDTVEALASPCDPKALAASADQTAAAVDAFYESATVLAAKLVAVNQMYGDACNAMNTDLGLPTNTDPGKACKTLSDYIAQKRAAGATVVVTITGGGCQVDASVEASCQAKCTGSASCDVEAHCEPGKLSGSCSATCSGSCEVQAPTFACSGTCYGECQVTAGATCSGECTGSCTGVCQGTCDGVATSSGAAAGNCKGTCVGSCDAQCKGSCNVAAGASCTGQCKGTCVYNPGSATCSGTCHGDCSVKYTAPRCDGKLSCTSDVNCQASCKGKAQATVTCADPQVQINVLGDAKLAATLVKNGKKFGQAFLETLALKDPVLTLVNNTVAAYNAAGNLVGNEISCARDAVLAFGDIKIQVEVSVQASATFNASSS